MSSSTDKKHLFDKPENVKRLLYSLYVSCVVLFALDFIIHRHASREWEGLPGFYAIYGFLAFVFLVLVAKLMRRLLMRKQGYYDVDE